MKLPALLLTVSLLANAALVGVLVTGLGDSSTTVVVIPSSPTAIFTSTAARTADAAHPADAKSAASVTVKPQEAWDHLQNDDLAALVTRLRAAGFPPSVIRRMIGALVNERFDAKRLALEKDRLDTPFFVNLPNEYNDPKLGPALRDLAREQTLMIKQLLGGNLNDLFGETEDNRAMLRLQIGNVPPEKLEQLYDTVMKFGNQQVAIRGGGNNGPLLDADREKLVAIDQAMRTEMATYLTPAQVDDFVMHSSSTAGQLRQLIGPLQPTEAEYRAIFPLYQAFSEQFPQQPDHLAPDQAAARKLAEDQMNNQIKGLLSPDQATDYEQASNPAYNQLNRLVGRLDLPLSAAAQVAAVQTDIQQRATDVRNDNTLSRSDRTTQLTALAQEASGKISAALGANGLEAYKTYGGQWLQNLVPRPPAPKPKG